MKRYFRSVSAILLALAMVFTTLTVTPFPAKAASTGKTGEEINGLFYLEQSRDTSFEFHYKDSYFYHDSYEYDPSLSTMSLCLALSAFNAAEAEGGETDFSHRYKNVEDLMCQLGGRNFEVNDEFIGRPQTDSIGVAMATRDMILENGETRSLLMVAIRGGGYGAEWASNVGIGDSGEHAGFAQARDKVVDFMNDYIKRHRDEITQQPKVWIVGYSRASATANLTGNFLNRAIENMLCPEGDDRFAEAVSIFHFQLDVQKKDLFCYGFEVPKGGHNDSPYAPFNPFDPVTDPDYKKDDEQNANLFCIVNREDPVPLVAPKAWGFCHYGVEIDLTEGVTEEKFLRQMYNVDWGLQNTWKWRPGNDGFKVYDSSDPIDLLKFLVKQKLPDKPISIEKSAVGKTKAEFLSKLVDMMARFMESREAYASVLQKYMPTVCRVIMGTTHSESELLGKAFSTAFDEIFGKMTYIELGWDLAFNEPSFYDDLTTLLKRVVYRAYELTKNDGIWTLNDVGEIVDCIRALMPILQKFLYEPNGIEWLYTLFYYSSSLFLPHYPEYVYAFLREKDPNYKELSKYEYIMTIEDANGKSLDDLCIEFFEEYDTDRSHHSLIGSFTSQGFTYADGMQKEFNEEITVAFIKAYRGTKDKIVIRVNNRGIALQSRMITIRNLSEEYNNLNLNVHVDYWEPHKNETQSRTTFSGVPIPISSRNEELWVELGMYNKIKATKYIKLEPIFTDMNFNPLEGGEFGVFINEKTAPERTSCQYNYTFYEMDTPEGTKLYDLCSPILDEDGNIMRYENGRPMVTNVDKTHPGLNMSSRSNIIYIRCIDETKVAKVTAQLIIQDAELGEPVETQKLGPEAVTVTNETTRETITRSEQSLLATVGDTITVTVKDSLLKDKAYFHNWVVDNTALDALITNPNTNQKSFTFTMPEGRVDLLGLCTPCTDDTTLTFTGIWADPNNGKPNHTEAKWQVVSVDPAFADDCDVWHYGYLTKTFKQMRKGAQAEAWIAAPDLPVDKYGDLVFDHWSVTETATGLPANYRMAWLGDDIVSPDGCTDRTLHLTHITTSLTVRPVYVDVNGYSVTIDCAEEYVYQNVQPGSENVYEPVLGDDCSYGSVKAYYYPVVETTDYWGNVTRSVKGKTPYYGVAFNEEEAFPLSFTMPRGDITIEVENVHNEHEVTVNGGFAVTPEEGFIKGANVTVYPTSAPRGKMISGWTTTPVVTTIALLNEDKTYRYVEFSMPAEDILIEAEYADLPSYSLKVDGGSVEADGTLLEAEEDGSYKVYAGEYIHLIPEEREGQIFTGWSVTEGGLRLSEENEAMNGFEMPAEDTGIQADFVILEYVDKIELTLEYEPAGEVWLPENAVCETPGIAEEWPIISWDTSKAWMENPAMFNTEYGFSTTLHLVDETYRFTDDLKVTLDGKECDRTVNPDGSLTVTCSLTTDWAYITGIAPVERVVVKNGTPLGTAAGEEGTIAAQLPTYTEVILGDDSQLVRIDWDLANVKYNRELRNGQTITVKGKVCENLFKAWPYMETNTKLADGVMDEVVCRVTVLAGAKVTVPRVTDPAAQPGVYVIDTNGNNKSVKVHLSCDTPHTQIYAALVENDEIPEDFFDEDLVVDLGDVIGPDDFVEMRGKLNEKINYKIYAFAVVTEEFTETVNGEEILRYVGDHSDIVIYNYSLREKDLRRFTVTVKGGSGSGVYTVDETVRAVAETPERNMSFTGFTADPDTLEFLTDSTDSMKRFRMPAGNVSLTAQFEISALTLGVDEPQPGEAFPSEVRFSDTVPSFVDRETAELVWTDNMGREVTGEAAGDCTYLAVVRLKIREGAENVSFSDELYAFMNGMEAQVEHVGAQEITLTLAFRTPEVTEPIFSLSLTVDGGNAAYAKGGLPSRGEDSESLVVKPEDKMKLSPETPEDMEFVSWEVEEGEVDLDYDEDGFGSFSMPDDDVVLRAVFRSSVKPVVSMDITVEAPKAGKPLAAAAGVSGEGVANGTQAILWMNAADEEVSGDADYDRVYRSRVELIPAEGYALVMPPKVTVNGETVTAFTAEGDKIYVGFTFATENGQYSFIEGLNSSWTPDSEGGLHFKTDGPFESLKAIKVNGVTLEQKYFTVAKGSTVIDLKEEFLRSLEAGTYTLSATYENGACETNFMVGESEMAPTGDHSRPVLYLCVFCLSAAALYFAAPRPRKKEE